MVIFRTECVIAMVLGGRTGVMIVSMGDTSQDSTVQNSLETVSRVTPGVKESHAEEKKSKKTVRFYKLFTFADSRDKVLMTIGTIAAIGNGL